MREKEKRGQGRNGAKKKNREGKKKEHVEEAEDKGQEYEKERMPVLNQLNKKRESRREQKQKEK